MRILCIIDNLGPGGSQRQLVELAIGFRKHQHDVSFLIYHDVRFFAPYLEQAGIPIHLIRESAYLKRLLRIRRFIRQENYQVVLSFLEVPNFICEIAGFPTKKWKLIVGERSANPGIFKSLKLIAFRWFHFMADYIVTNSHANMKIILTVCPLLNRRKFRVIYNAVNLSFWRPSSEYIPRRNGRLKLVVTASHRHVKNLNNLIIALSLLHKDDLDKININWYGDSLTEPYIDNSIQQAELLISKLNLCEAITFYPSTKNIKEIIQDADAVGLFSLYEGFPNSICEGMACGKPVICSRISDIPELMAYNDGLLFDPKKPDSIAQSLKYLISLPNKELFKIGETNLQIARETFEQEKNIDQFIQLLEK